MTGDELSRQFWLIILTTWMMDEVSALETYAEKVEASVSW